MVKWRTKEDHTQGVRKSPKYQRWKALLHHFYQPFPEVGYFDILFCGGEQGF